MQDDYDGKLSQLENEYKITLDSVQTEKQQVCDCVQCGYIHLLVGVGKLVDSKSEHLSY